MLTFFKDLFSGPKSEGDSPEPEKKEDPSKKIQIATCALFLEVANSDDNFTKEEKEEIFIIMKDTFALDKTEVEELIKLSEEQVKKSVSLYEFTDVINNGFSREDKFQVLKNLWRLIFIDEELHHYEDYFIRKISSNLKLSHQDMIAAKLSVKTEMGLK